MPNDDYVNRANAAYYRAAASLGGQVVQPGSTELVTHEGLTYVVMRNVNGVLAVYRVRNDGMLKGLKRWPKALEDS